MQRENFLRSMEERISDVERGSCSLPSSSTKETDQDCISSSRGRRLLVAVADETRVLRCMGSLGALEREGTNVDCVGIALRRENCSCDASIGAIKTRWRAEAVLNTHLELRILLSMRLIPYVVQISRQSKNKVKSSFKASSPKILEIPSSPKSRDFKQKSNTTSKRRQCHAP
jgi:hypothetical protein